MTRRAVAGDELVHDAAAHADEFVLRALAGKRKSSEIDRKAARAEQGIAGRNLDRRRRRQPGAERNVAVDQKVGAG